MKDILVIVKNSKVNIVQNKVSSRFVVLLHRITIQSKLRIYYNSF